MATTNLPPTAYVPVGSEFEQGRPLGSRVRFNGEGGVRRAWWWEAGPVDSCCFCCSLAAGVTMLVLMDVVLGIFAFYSLTAENEERDGMIVHLKDKYAQECEGVEEPPPDCATVSADLLQLTTTEDFYILMLLQGIISLLFGLIGLWSVITHNAFAAKVYLWSWPLRFLLRLVETIMQRFRLRHYHMGFLWHLQVVGALFGTALLAYYAKVTWSYYLMLKRKSRAALSASESAGGIELDGSTDTVV
ncbi:unnamed protein product [Scytosiphon promiscuus]